MINTTIIILLFSFSQYLCQSISGSTSECGPKPIAAACGKGTVLLGQSHIGIPAACFLKVDPGPCSHDLVRIYYDSKTYTCKAFSFSGCGGNANRFVSVKNCYKLCHPYYRQRFVGLGADRAANAKHADGSEGSVTNYSSLKPNDLTSNDLTSNSAKTTNSTSNTNSTETNNSINNNKKNRNTTEETAKVQVIHETDAYIPVAPQTRSGYPAAPPNDYQPPNYGYPEGPQSKNGFLRNIQHENYQPMAGFISNKHGFYPQPIQSQRTYYTQYK